MGSKALLRRYTAVVKAGQPIKPRFISHRREEPVPKDEEPDYMILEAVYDTHAIVFFCTNIIHEGKKAHMEKIEILTRRSSAPLKDEEDLKTKALKLVANITGLSRHTLVENDLTREDCYGPA